MRTIFLLIISLLSFEVAAQSNRIRFKYKISNSTLERLKKDGFSLTDVNGTEYSICSDKSHWWSRQPALKAYISQDKNILTVDPWTIINGSCADNSSIVNKDTPNSLKIDLRKPATIGDKTKSIRLNYESFIFGVNIGGLKIRPRVTDYNGNIWAANAFTGSFNFGLSYGYSFGRTIFTRRGYNSFSTTPSLGLGFSAASLAKEPLKRAVVTSYNPSNLILSPVINITFARNDVGIIVSGGLDYMCGRHATAWSYQGRPFVAIGIAAGLKL